MKFAKSLLKISVAAKTGITLSILCFVSFILNHPGEKLSQIILSDAFGYYQYLPAIFNGGDLNKLAYAVMLENGNMLNVFHIGVAILEAPFFLIANGLAPLFGYKQDGLSDIYMYGIGFGAALYLGFGIYFLMRFLNEFFDWKISLATILLLFFGTNLYYYSSMEVGMSHVYSFFLFSVFLFVSHRFHAEQTYGRALLLGLLAGLIIVIRPNNGIIVMALIFYSIQSVKEVIPRLGWWIKNFKFVALMLASVSVICFFQMAYWHRVSDKWLMFSYGQIGQQFFWAKAVMGKVLFSPQNGFLVYAPIMIFALIGLIWGSFKKIGSFFVFLAIWALAWYIFASWWAWWFGGAYGHRAFIEYFVILAPGMAYFINRVYTKKWILIPWSMIALVLLFVSVRMTFIYQPPWDGPEWGWDDYNLQLEKVFFQEKTEK